MPTYKNRQPIKPQNSLASNVLVAITTALEKPLTRKEFLTACTVIAAAYFVYSKEFYPKFSFSPILTLFKRESENKQINNEVAEELTVPNNSGCFSSEQDDITSSNDHNTNKDENPDVAKAASGDLITDDEHNDVQKIDSSNRGWFSGFRKAS